MIMSLALIFIVGMTLGSIAQLVKLPKLVGLLVTGIVLSPFMLDLIAPEILGISAELRKIALIVILLKAGLSLDIRDLKKVGRPAILMSFLPATFEIIGVIIFAPLLFGISLVEAGLLGAVLGAVSPAVIVPKMVDLMAKDYGKKNSLPQLILAAASMDDIFVIVIFTSFLGLSNGESLNVMSFAQIPISIILGIIMGVVLGVLMSIFFKALHIRDSVKVLIILSVAFMMVSVEDMLVSIVPISGLVAVMVSGMSIKLKRDEVATRLSVKFSKLWLCAEIVLFVLVGATVNLDYAVSITGLMAILLVVIALCFRMTGVFVCLLKTKLTLKEKFFCMISFTPKATVQAAIGAIPLSMGLPAGELILTVAVISILLTAPLGAFSIDLFTKKFKL